MWTIHCPGLFGLLRLSTRNHSTAEMECGPHRTIPPIRAKSHPVDSLFGCGGILYAFLAADQESITIDSQR
jgi:hypothetical protein